MIISANTESGCNYTAREEDDFAAVRIIGDQFKSDIGRFVENRGPRLLRQRTPNGDPNVANHAKISKDGEGSTANRYAMLICLICGEIIRLSFQERGPPSG